MTDLQTLANEINEALAAAKAPLYVLVGKRSVKWFKRYAGCQSSGYKISKGEAANALRYYELQGLAQ